MSGYQTSGSRTAPLPVRGRGSEDPLAHHSLKRTRWASKTLLLQLAIQIGISNVATWLSHHIDTHPGLGALDRERVTDVAPSSPTSQGPRVLVKMLNELRSRDTL